MQGVTPSQTMTPPQSWAPGANSENRPAPVARPAAFETVAPPVLHEPSVAPRLNAAPDAASLTRLFETLDERLTSDVMEPNGTQPQRNALARGFDVVIDYLDRFRWAGSGHRQALAAGQSPLLEPSPASSPAPFPRFNIGRNGAADYVVAWLYFFSGLRSQTGSPMVATGAPGNVMPYTLAPTLEESAHLSHLRVRRDIDALDAAHPFVVNQMTASPSRPHDIASNASVETPEIETDVAALLHAETTNHEVQAYFEALRQRTRAHEAALARTERVFNLRQTLSAEFERRIQAAASPHNGTPPRLDDVKLTQFNMFRFDASAPVYDNAHLERWRPRQSLSVVDAAMHMLGGSLRIDESITDKDGHTSRSVRPDYGIHVGALDQNRRYHAQDQVPGLSTADLFDVIRQWQWLTTGDDDAGYSSEFVQALHHAERQLAFDDLQLSYLASHISADAVVLGEIILHLPEAAARHESDGQQAGVTAYQIYVKTTGYSDPIAPAGMFFVSAQPARGAGLLYVAGDPNPWREYQDRSALMQDLTAPTGSGLHDVLKARLPRADASHQITAIQLTPTPDDPLLGARYASLSVVRSDMRTDFNAATSPERVSDYTSWFSGSAPHLRSHALHALGAARTPGIALSPPRSPALGLPENIADAFQSLLDMRLQISTAMPTQRRVARSLASEVLSELGAKGIDPDDVRLTIGEPLRELDAGSHQTTVSYRLPDAVLKHVEGTLAVTPSQTMSLSTVTAHREPSTAVSLPPADRLVGHFSVDRFRLTFDRQFRGFMSEHRDALRRTAASTFVLDAVAMQTHKTLSAEHIALAKSVAKRAGFDDLARLLPGADNRPFQQAWLSVDDIASLSIVLTDRSNGSVLFYTPTSPDAVLRGFKNRSALDKWLASRLPDADARAQIVAMFPAAARERVSARFEQFAALASTNTAPFAANDKPFAGEVFASVLDSFIRHGETVKGADDLAAANFGTGVLLATAHAIRWLDIGLGLGAWFGESLGTASLAVSAVDGALGISMVIGGNDEMRTEGWYSLATAIGAGAASAARQLTLKSVLAADGYAYMFNAPVEDNDQLVDGLYYVGDRFVAQFGQDADSAAFAGVTLEPETGEFRLINMDLASLGGYVRLSRTGNWGFIRTPPPGIAPAINTPHVAYAVERAYGQRLSAAMNSGTSAERQAFRVAKREAYERSLLGQAERVPSMVQKVRFLDPRLTDAATLGAIAGDVESAQAAEAAAQEIANLAAQASTAGAAVRTVPQIRGLGSGTLDRGLVRVMALASRDGRDGALLGELERLAQAPDASATKTYVARVQALGRNEAAGESFSFRGNAPNSVKLSDLDSLFRGKATSPATFEITTRDHGMLLGRRLTHDRDVEYFFFDPASSFVAHRSKSTIVELTAQHLSNARAAYTPYSLAGQPAVMVREIDVARLAEGAAGTVRAGDLVPRAR